VVGTEAQIVLLSVYKDIDMYVVVYFFIYVACVIYDTVVVMLNRWRDGYSHSTRYCSHIPKPSATSSRRPIYLYIYIYTYICICIYIMRILVLVLTLTLTLCSLKGALQLLSKRHKYNRFAQVPERISVSSSDGDHHRFILDLPMKPVRIRNK